MFLRTVFSVCLIGAPCAAENWSDMLGDEIRAMLNDRSLKYEFAFQEFKSSGKTNYVADRESWGNWRVQGNQYCSQWPPNSDWACYSMQKNDKGTKVRFIGSGDDITTGTFFEK